MATIPEKLKNLTLKGKTIGFFVKSGTVMGNKIWSETQISSSTLLSEVPRISSKVTTNQEIWIRSNDGKEFNIQGDQHIKVNGGHDVSVIYAGFKDTGWPVCIVNRTTDYWHSVNSSKWFVKQMGITAVGILLYFAPAGYIFLKARGEAKFIVPIFWLLMVYAFRSLLMDAFYKSRLEKHIKQIAQSLF